MPTAPSLQQNDLLGELECSV
uniref:Uncharacterized protein n=1 Tax=Arundo donax TaxID=35708 RepID=A0A0A9AUT9_ARUDO